ncbi:endonuclease/exonuclease/phosphatase family protein [Lentibacillus sp. Marseille-P4043]|uniref:endonuclease/exonuclease/phosphatase family protein n=1 Tax=Lentibacillus sp. Marseille-P4043 TaxID=2040293 RepID=UPI000D0B1CB5|nr:endonuclease/exonuclease/phosphatase family protein [Lentibacillus sp. Marseille-P4043]
MKKLKIVTWNIRQGGRKAIQQIVNSLISHQADLIVLTEYKNNDAGAFLVSELRKEGWTYIQSSYPPKKENGILILSAYPLKDYSPPFSKQQGSHRWNEVYIPSHNIYLLGVHVPNVNETYDKAFFWQQIVQYAHHRTNDKAIIVGDFNTARRDEKENAPLKYSNFIMKLLESGWTDAWKKSHAGVLDYTWYSTKNNGFRLDYIFLSPKLSGSLLTCYLSHRERIENFSDHSLLAAELIEYVVKNGYLEKKVLQQDPFQVLGSVTEIFRDNIDDAKKIIGALDGINWNSEYMGEA